jgi:hypothetical protein
MKELLNKLKLGIEELAFILMPIPFLIGIIGLFSCFLLGNTTDLERFVFLFLIGLVFLLLRLHWNKGKIPKLLKNIKYTTYIIDLVTEEQFCLQRTDYDAARESPYIIENRLIYWRKIKDITFDATATNLTILFKNKEELIFPKIYDGWYAFIKQVPIATYPSFDTKIVNELYKQLEACKICSAIAVADDMCYNCYNDVWGKIREEEEGISEVDYIKEEQLSYFATDEEGEAIDFSLGAFDRLADWKLLVSEEAILEYSSELFW